MPKAKIIISPDFSKGKVKKFLNIYLLTLNTAGKEPVKEALKSLIEYKNILDIDMFVIALQELPLKSIFWMNNWKREFENLFQIYNFVLLKHLNFSVTEILVFVNKRDLSKYSKVSANVVVFNAITLKCAICISLTYDCFLKFAFIGAHFTPHDENYSKRIMDYTRTISEMKFNDEKNTIENQDYVFFMGDLNFRLNPLNVGEDEWNYIVNFVKCNENNTHPQRFEPLLIHDQIRYAKSKGEAFDNFEEAQITFPPTFKYEDNEFSNKRRPAWTDRIFMRNLLKIQKNEAMHKNRKLMDIDIESTINNYNSIVSFIYSDHKPVKADVKIPLVNVKQFKWLLKTWRSENIAEIEKEAKIARQATTGDLSNLVPDSLAWFNVDDSLMFKTKVVIEFYHIPNWNETRKFFANFRIILEDINGDRNPISVREPMVRSFLSIWDWVGLFPEDYSSLDDYIMYSHPNFGSVIPTEEATDALSLLTINSDLPDTESIRDHSPQGDNIENDERPKSEEETTTTVPRQGTSTETESSTSIDEVLSVVFDESYPLLAGHYVLLYFRANGDVIGASDPFHLEYNIDLSSAI